MIFEKRLINMHEKKKFYFGIIYFLMLTILLSSINQVNAEKYEQYIYGCTVSEYSALKKPCDELGSSCYKQCDDAYVVGPGAFKSVDSIKPWKDCSNKCGNEVNDCVREKTKPCVFKQYDKSPKCEAELDKCKWNCGDTGPACNQECVKANPKCWPWSSSDWTYYFVCSGGPDADSWKKCTNDCDAVIDVCKDKCLEKYNGCKKGVQEGTPATTKPIETETVKKEELTKDAKAKEVEKEKEEQQESIENPYLDTAQIKELKDFSEEVKGINDKIKTVLEASDKSKDELELLEEFSDNLGSINNELKDIGYASDLWDIVMTDGPKQDWKDITYDSVKPGFFTRLKRGIVDFFKGKHKPDKMAEKVQDIYAAMKENKEEQEFYKQDLSNRLMEYAYKKTVEELSDKAKEKAKETLESVIGKGSMLGVSAITTPIGILFEEAKKPAIGNYYLAYAEYRKKSGSHEQALQNMKIDIEDGGISTGSQKGISGSGFEEVVDKVYHEVGDKEMLMEAFKKVYEAEDGDKK